MKWVQRLAHSAGGIDTGERPRLGRVIQPRAEDAWRGFPSAGLTPSRLMNILREADEGSPATALQLFEEMEEKDAHLYAVANTRRLAVTGLDWEVVSAADVRRGADRVAADEAAAFCREVLLAVDNFDAALQHLSLALGRNIAVAELVWEVSGGALVLADICPIAFTRIVFDDFGQPRLLTDEAPMDGVPLEPHKFVVHTPHSVSGHASRGGLLRVTAMCYLGKNLAMKDWMIFSEVFGMPVRIARYDPSASAEEKREMLNMLESLGSNAAGIFSRAIDLQIVEANRGTQGPPYGDLIDFFNREISKAWLGQTLTTETNQASGVLSATQIHEKVRKDIRADDIRKEGHAIRRDVLRPLTRFQFGDTAPVPFFRRKPAAPQDVEQLGEVLGLAVNELGMRVPQRWAHDALGIPEAAPGESVLGGVGERSPAK